MNSYSLSCQYMWRKAIITVPIVVQEPKFEPLRTMEVFAGAGGLAQGLKQVGDVHS